MRVFKTGAARALVIATAAAAQAGGAEAQVVRGRDISEPLERVRQIVTVFGGSRIGISIDDVDADDAKAKKLPGESGVSVEQVDQNSPASKAGIKAGDVIVEFDGERVRSTTHLRRLIQETPSGRRVAIIVMRDGQRVPLTVTPDGRGSDSSVWAPRGFEAAPRAPRPPRAPLPPEPPDIDVRIPQFDLNLREPFILRVGGRLGVGTQTLTDQLAKHFGVERGVLVTEVDENSAASKAGLQAGDVITKFNGQTVADSGDLAREVGRADGEVAIEIVRDRKTQTIKAMMQRARNRTIRRVI